MIDALIAITGQFFLVAVALEFLTVFAEQGGGARRAGDEKPRPGFGAFALMILAMLTPGLLLVHAFVTTMGVVEEMRIWAIGAVIAAVVLGALIGLAAGLFGGEAFARLLRFLALPLGLAAFALAIFVARPSINTLIGWLQGGVPPT